MPKSPQPRSENSFDFFDENELSGNQPDAETGEFFGSRGTESDESEPVESPDIEVLDTAKPAKAARSASPSVPPPGRTPKPGPSLPPPPAGTNEPEGPRPSPNSGRPSPPGADSRKRPVAKLGDQSHPQGPPPAGPSRGRAPASPVTGVPADEAPPRQAPVNRKQPAPPGVAPTQTFGNEPRQAPVNRKQPAPPGVAPTQTFGNEPRNDPGPKPTSRKGRAAAKRRRLAQQREERWSRNRLAVPYYTDGPKITFGVIWFVALFSSVLFSPYLVAITTTFVAALAGLQTGHAWLKDSPGRIWAAAACAIIPLCSVFGLIGTFAGVIVSLVISLTYLLAGNEPGRSSGQLFDVLIRSTLPAGIAAGCLVTLTGVVDWVAIGLVLLISSYEAGDFLVGSGSRTAFEGPIAGFISLAIMAFVLSTVVPSPFTPATVVAFAAIAAIGSLAGQIFASAALPRGVSWAPALRRLDSYIIAGPIWLLLVFLLISGS